MSDQMRQVAPFPTILAELVDALTYRPRWRTTLEDLDRGQGSEGLTLCIYTIGFDTYNVEAGENYGVVHYFPVPPAAYNAESWTRWLFERFHDVELHECAEFFQIGEDRPFAPQHGPGNDPYIIFHQGSEIERRTRSDGTVAPS